MRQVGESQRLLDQPMIKRMGRCRPSPRILMTFDMVPFVPRVAVYLQNSNRGWVCRVFQASVVEKAPLMLENV